MSESLEAFARRMSALRLPKPSGRGMLAKHHPPFACPFCDGTGEWEIGDQDFQDLVTPCQRCEGTGKLDTWEACSPYAGGDYNGHCGGCDECELMRTSTLTQLADD